MLECFYLGEYTDIVGGDSQGGLVTILGNSRAVTVALTNLYINQEDAVEAWAQELRDDIESFNVETERLATHKEAAQAKLAWLGSEASLVQNASPTVDPPRKPVDNQGDK